MGILGKIGSLILPFFLAFIVAYALYPFLKFLTDKKIPKALAVAIILLIILGVISILGVLIAPLLVDQVISLLNTLIAFVKEFSLTGDFNIASLQDTLTSTFNDIIVNVGKYATDGVTKAINVSMGYLATFLIAFSAAIYLLVDMGKIRAKVKEFLLKKSTRAFEFVKLIDDEMKSYLVGILKVMLITVVEYSLAYIIIGHPDAILLGVLAMVGVLIPYFGGIMTNIVAAITAFVISPVLFLKTVITFVILSAVDGYVINPLVYGKSNNVHPLIVIMSVFVGGKLAGVFGIMISFPVAVIIISTIKFFKEDINGKIENIKRKD
jgi:predicted PurR-regulated permease PerM